MLHHGAGYSALTFALLAQELLRCGEGQLAIIAFDMRGHGLSSGDCSELSLECLCADFVSLMAVLQKDWTAPHPLHLTGHSLGGSVMTRCCSLMSDVQALIVIDIVEEAAMAALPLMGALLRTRPHSFATPDAAIRWALRAHLVRNRLSAAISVPAQLVPDSPSGFRWRCDLLRCQEHWPGWFQGLSLAFVAAPLPKVLVMAEREYLDRTLMIASMQGRFQTSIVRDTTHAIQEDQPQIMAQIISSFFHRVSLLNRLNQSTDQIQR